MKVYMLVYTEMGGSTRRKGKEWDRGGESRGREWMSGQEDFRAFPQFQICHYATESVRFIGQSASVVELLL